MAEPSSDPAIPAENAADTAPALSDEVLQRLVARDPDALEVFFDAYFDRVFAYVRRLLGEEHLAEDVTQDVFLHVYRSFPSYDPQRDLRPWVFTIATNKVRDFWRSRRHRDSQREKSVEVEGSADHLADGGERPDSSLTQGELNERIRNAVDRLPDGMRTTVLLRVYEGLSFEAIGEVLDRNEVAVRKRYSRALELLRSTLGPGLQAHQEEV